MKFYYVGVTLGTSTVRINRCIHRTGRPTNLVIVEHLVSDFEPSAKHGPTVVGGVVGRWGGGAGGPF